MADDPGVIVEDEPVESVQELDEPESAVLSVIAQTDIPVIPGENEFRSLAMQAKLLSESSLIPSALRGKPHDVLLVLMTGRDLGIAPTTALRKCYVVDSQVTIAPMLKAALVKMNGKGRVEPAPGNTKDSATSIAYGPDGEEIIRYTLTWDDVKDVTIDAAHRKKMVDKDNWRNWRARMLYHRVQGFLIDDVWPEVSLGVYHPDDIGAVTDENGQVIDVREVAVPAGYEKQRKDEPAIVDEATAEALRARANGLPTKELRDEFRDFIRDRAITGFPRAMHASKVKVVEPFLATLEKRGATQRSDIPNDGESPVPVESVDRPTNVDTDGVIDVTETTQSEDARLGGHTVIGLSVMARGELLALPEPLMRAAAEIASGTVLPSTMQHAEVVDEFIDSTAPF